MLKKIVHFLQLLRSEEPRDRIYLENRISQTPILRTFYISFKRRRARKQKTSDDYVTMQRAFYEKYASADNVTVGHIDGDYVVGSWAAHDQWTDYAEFLMRYVPDNESWLALEYGCGPGRNIRRWTDRFRRIDGVDISAQNLTNARKFLSEQIDQAKTPQLFLTQGQDCGDAPGEYYDFAFSTICFQHICVHSVRFAILKSLYRALRPGGRLSIQMGFGVPSPHTRPYFEDYFQAIGTNRSSDVAISTPDEPRSDLEKLGFTNFEYWIRPVGPGDSHPQWIFFTALKPKTGANDQTPA